MLDELRFALTNLGGVEIHARIRDLLAPLQEAEPSESDAMDTLGSLVDKLCIVNLKMWHNQERLYEIRRMSSEEFVAKWGDQLDDLHQVVKRCCDLNVQRAALIDEIDGFLGNAMEGRVAIQRPQHKTY